MWIERIEVFTAVLLAAIPLVGLARRWNIPYPIALVTGGLILGFIPILPRIDLDPNLVLLLFLPPILYWESITAPTDDIGRNAQWVWSLALGLVIGTIAVVTVVAHVLDPMLAWGAAFILGTVIAPTDEVAAVPIAQRLGVPRHVVAIIEGEALLNDAASLVLYTAGIAAVVSGVYAIRPTMFAFAFAAAGGFVIGLIAGAMGVLAWRTFRDSHLQAVISVLLPFIAYIPAQDLHTSGVLAVVTAGIFVNRYTPIVMTPEARESVAGWYEITLFLINATLFILLGVQLHAVVSAVLAEGRSWGELLRDAIGLNLAIAALRFIWFFGHAALQQRSSRYANEPKRWRHLVVAGYCGMRGAVSLAAALAIPQRLSNGAPFPSRDLILFLTFSVILVTLIGEGLTLPSLIRFLGIPPDEQEQRDYYRALQVAANAALVRLGELEKLGSVDSAHAQELRERFHTNVERYESSSNAEDRKALERFDIERELLLAQRKAIVQMRKNGEIENVVLRRIQATYDLHEIELQRAAAGVRDDMRFTESHTSE